MSKDLIEKWCAEGYAPIGVSAFRKEIKKYYPAYKDKDGNDHEAQERTIALEVEFDSSVQQAKFNQGEMIQGIFHPAKMNTFSMTMPTFRLLFFTMKELGWK